MVPEWISYRESRTLPAASLAQNILSTDLFSERQRQKRRTQTDKLNSISHHSKSHRQLFSNHKLIIFDYVKDAIRPKMTNRNETVIKVMAIFFTAFELVGFFCCLLFAFVLVRFWMLPSERFTNGRQLVRLRHARRAAAERRCMCAQSIILFIFRLNTRQSFIIRA